MMKNSRRQIALVVAACMVFSSLCVLIPLGKSTWGTQNTSTTSSVAKILVVGDTKADGNFTFTNDTQIASFTVDLGNKSTGAFGKEYNLTLFNMNGTAVSATVVQNHAWACCGGTWIQPQQVGQTINTKNGPYPNVPYPETNVSMIITVLSPVTLCIEVQPLDFQRNPWTSYGGWLQIAETGSFQSVAKPVDKPISGVNLTDVLHAYDTQFGGYYAQEFTVSTSGAYKIDANVTSTRGQTNPNVAIYVYQKGAGGVLLGATDPYVLGLGQNIISQQPGPFTITSNTTKYYSFGFLNVVLQPATTYVVLFVPILPHILDPGYLNYFNVTPVTTLTGTLGSPVVVDFTSKAATVIQFGDSSYGILVSYASAGLAFDTLYNTALTAPAWPWTAMAEGNVFSLVPNWVMAGSTGQFLVTKDTVAPCSIDGQPLDTQNQVFNMWTEYGTWGNYTPVIHWGSSNGMPISGTVWSGIGAFVEVDNSSNTNALPSVNLTVSVGPNVPDLTNASFVNQSTTDTSFYSKTFKFQNDGAKDDMGLYKITGKKGTEWQFQVANITCVPTSGASNTYTIYPFTGVQQNMVEPNIYPDVGFTLPRNGGPFTKSTGTGATRHVEFDNTTYTWSTVPAHPEFDSPKVYECAIFADTLYVVVIPNGYVSPAYSNSTGFALNWTFEPFLKSGDTFVVSRDNQIQCFDVTIPACGVFTMKAVYGLCSPSSSGLDLFPEPFVPCYVLGGGWEGEISGEIFALPQGFSLGFPTSFHAYAVWDNANNGDSVFGTVLQFTVTSCVPVDWLAWGIAIAALAALVIVLVILLRRKVPA